MPRDMSKHQAFVRDLHARFAEAGFHRVRFHDEDEGWRVMPTVDALLEEVFSVDECHVSFRNLDTGASTTLWLILCNSAWETVADLGGNDEGLAVADPLTSALADEYLARDMEVRHG